MHPVFENIPLLECKLVIQVFSVQGRFLNSYDAFRTFAFFRV